MTDNIETNPEERITLVEYLHETGAEATEGIESELLVPSEVAMAHMLADLLNMEAQAARERLRREIDAVPFPFFEIRAVNGEVSLIWKLETRAMWGGYLVKSLKLEAVEELSKLLGQR